MKLNPIKSNITEVEFEDREGTHYKVLFSYKTPVAYTKTWRDGGFIARRTSKKWSRTTSKHINQWFRSINHCECDQEELDNLVK